MTTRRETIEPHAGDKRYIRRDSRGRFTSDQSTVSRSLSTDRERHAKKTVPAGQGDRGDQKKR